jgi:Secretion system C-terminal sorting domain
MLMELQASVYPNPATGVARINLGDFNTNSVVTIIDLNGKLLATYSSLNKNHINIDVSAYAVGEYFAILRSGKKLRVLKFIKK